MLDSIISIVKTHSIYKNDVDWSILEKNIYKTFVDSDSNSSTMEPVKYFFTKIGDFHGFVNYISRIQIFWFKKKRNVPYLYLHKS